MPDHRGEPRGHPSLAQMRDWTERLGELASEMEDAYGPCGETNPNVVDAAVHVAFNVALRERDWMEEVAKSVAAFDAPAPVDRMSGRVFKLFFSGDAPAAGYAIDMTTGKLYRNGEIWGHVEHLNIDAATTLDYVAYKRIENGEVIANG